MRYIDLNTYPRRTHFDYFRNMTYPYVGVTANVDVTNLVNFAKARQGSTFLACLWAAANAANSIPELRQRIQGENIAEFDHCDTSHTVALADKTFANCRTDCRCALEEFLIRADRCQDEARQRHGFDTHGDSEDDLMFVSCLPWVEFTQVIQPSPVPADCIPRLVFGQYRREDGRIRMPLHIQCNHALVDGWHLGEFFRRFQELADSIV